MLTLNQYKRLLGSHADGMSDEDIVELRRLQYALIDIAIRVWTDSLVRKKPDI